MICIAKCECDPSAIQVNEAHGRRNLYFADLPKTNVIQLQTAAARRA